MRHCSFCYGRGHNRTTCPAIKKRIEEDPDCYFAQQENLRKDRQKASRTTRKCSYCKQTGHNKKTCDELKTDIVAKAREVATFRKQFTDRCRDLGLGIGTLLKHVDPSIIERDWQRQRVEDNIKHYGEYAILIGFRPDKITPMRFGNSYGNAALIAKTSNGKLMYFTYPVGFEDFTDRYTAPTIEIAGKVDYNLAGHFKHEWHVGYDVAESLLTFPKRA